MIQCFKGKDRLTDLHDFFSKCREMNLVQVKKIFCQKKILFFKDFKKIEGRGDIHPPPPPPPGRRRVNYQYSFIPVKNTFWRVIYPVSFHPIYPRQQDSKLTAIKFNLAI